MLDKGTIPVEKLGTRLVAGDSGGSRTGWEGEGDEGGREQTGVIEGDNDAARNHGKMACLCLSVVCLLT